MMSIWKKYETVFAMLLFLGTFCGIGIALYLLSIIFPGKSYDPRNDVKMVGDEDAHLMVGWGGEVFGKVAQVKLWRGYVFVNFGKPYPNQTFSAVIPPGHAKLHPFLPKPGEDWSVSGIVEGRKGKPQITATRVQQVNDWGRRPQRFGAVTVYPDYGAEPEPFYKGHFYTP